ncbi:MAG: hypothetical protein SPL28_09955 [Bacteroidales bacterium]|nr:hypothetical protein [Bacteroidales bacterium]
MKTHLLLTITAVLMLTGCSTAQKVQTNRVPHPVELTPFTVGNHERGLQIYDLKKYVAKMGYTENVTSTFTEWTGNDSGDIIELWRADNIDGKSFVEIQTWRDKNEIPIYVQWVCYTWHKKKDMPKGLYEGYEDRDHDNKKCSFLKPNCTTVYWSKYSNHYSIGTTAYNPYKPLRGNRLETPIKIQIVN